MFCKHIIWKRSNCRPESLVITSTYKHHACKHDCSSQTWQSGLCEVCTSDGTGWVDGLQTAVHPDGTIPFHPYGGYCKGSANVAGSFQSAVNGKRVTLPQQQARNLDIKGHGSILCFSEHQQHLSMSGAGWLRVPPFGRELILYYGHVQTSRKCPSGMDLSSRQDLPQDWLRPILPHVALCLYHVYPSPKSAMHSTCMPFQSYNCHFADAVGVYPFHGCSNLRRAATAGS